MPDTYTISELDPESDLAARRYSVGTWDMDLQAFTPQTGVPAFNLTLHQLRASLKMLRGMGYTAHRVREPDGDCWDNDTSVLVERTDGKSEAEILESWTQ